MQSEATELTFTDLFRFLIQSWVGLLVFTALGGLAAVAIVFSMTPVYRAQVLLSPAMNDGGSRGALSRLADEISPLAGIVGGMDRSAGFIGKDVWIAALRSRRLTEQFIREKDLLPILFPEQWEPSSGSWKVKNGRSTEPTMESAFMLFDQRIRTVSEDRRTNLVTLSIDWHDPEMAAEWANELVDQANTFIRDRTITESQRSISFLEEQLKSTSVAERQQIIYRLIESKIGEIMLANSREEYAFVIVDPAFVPGPNSFVRPRRLVITAIGLLLGLFAGLVCAVARKVNESAKPKIAA